MNTSLPNPGDLLPHQAPMLMLSAVQQYDDEQIRCISRIEKNNPLLSQGHFPCTGGLELLAQACGVLLGIKHPGLEVRPGAIVQVKSFQVSNAAIPAGSALQIQAFFRGGNAEAALFDGHVSFNTDQIFQGSLMIALLPEDTQ